MDRSYLSHTGVVAASRQFVCIRPATYESAEEAPFLNSLFRGRSAELENTVFAILSPDGKTRLCRTGRSPGFAFRSPDAMAAAMRQISQKYPGTAIPADQLPLLANVRLAVNVAACDSTPLAIVYSPDKATRDALSKRLGRLAWHKDHVGRLQYCVATKADELKKLGAEGAKPGLLVIQPGNYGTDGLVLTSVTTDADAGELEDALSFGVLLSQFQQKDRFRHVSGGRQLGISWQTVIPVTDSGGRRRR